jgi:hypothetical protein
MIGCHFTGAERAASQSNTGGSAVTAAPVEKLNASRSLP